MSVSCVLSCVLISVSCCRRFEFRRIDRSIDQRALRSNGVGRLPGKRDDLGCHEAGDVEQIRKGVAAQFDCNEREAENSARNRHAGLEIGVAPLVRESGAALE